MPIELVVPSVGESITEVEIGAWLKKVGDSVAIDDNLVVIDTAKATVELPSPGAGRLSQIIKKTGESAKIGDVIGYLEADGGATEAKGSNGAKTAAAKTAPAKSAKSKAASAKIAENVTAASSDAAANSTAAVTPKGAPIVMPAARRALEANGLLPTDMAATGPGGRLLKEDVENYVAAHPGDETVAPGVPSPVAAARSVAPAAATATTAESAGAHEQEEIVPMSLLRRTIATRLVQAQQTAALLTTFNEVDMSAVMAMRKEHQEAFQARYGIKLGFMSFFVKAVVDGLKQYPALNAEIRGRDIVYKNHYDIGVAIGSGKGLVVPVVRHAERLSFAEVENSIAEFATRVKNNTLSPEALEGGTFSITNGGIYGSLMSTPIVNPPQSGILGMHAITQRPAAVNGEVVVRPIMNIALTYDHRVVDGREAVSFLKRVKDCVENPARMLIEV